MTYIPGGGGGGTSSISTSGDVALNNVSTGQLLCYDASLAKWVNKNNNPVVKLSQAEYDVLEPKDPNAFYAIITDQVTKPPIHSSIGTFSETFEALNEAKWTIYPGAAAVSAELVLDASSTYSTIRTKDFFTIKNSAVRIQINQLPNVSNGSTQTWINYRIDASNSITFMWSNGTLYCRISVAGTETEATVAFDFATMRIWRIRETGGTIFWETSADNLSWMAHRSVPMPIEWTDLGGQVSLAAGNWNGATDPGQAKFDKLNIDDFIESFTGSNASAWSAEKWSLSPLGGGATDIDSNRGRLAIPDVDGAMVRATAKASISKTQSLLMSYALTDTSARSWIQIWLRGDGTWSGNKPGHGYALEIQSDASRVSLHKFMTATQTNLSAIEGVNSLIAGQKQWIRFEVAGTTIRYRLWPDGTSEPSTWTASVTDSAISQPGFFQLCAYRSTANVGAKTIFFDDIVLNDRVVEPVAGADDPTAPGAGALMNEPFDGSYNLSHSNNGTHPNIWVEHSKLNPVTISGGLMKLTGNSHTNSYNGYHRMFNRNRFGGPGKSLLIRYRARATTFYTTEYNGTKAGVKLGLKFPTSTTGFSEEDPRSVNGGGGSSSPGSLIFVTGLTPEGYMELARNKYGDGGYYTPWAYNKKVGYTVGSWKEITVRVDWVVTDEMRIRYWHNATGTGTPVYDWQGFAPYNEPGFLWYRTDFSDFEYDYMIIEEV